MLLGLLGLLELLGLLGFLGFLGFLGLLGLLGLLGFLLPEVPAPRKECELAAKQLTILFMRGFLLSEGSISCWDKTWEQSPGSRAGSGFRV